MPERQMAGWFAGFLLALGCGAACWGASPQQEAIGRALARTEAVASGQEVHGDTAFLFGQATRLTGHRVSLRLRPDALVARQHGMGAEYELWASRERPLPHIPPGKASGRGGSFDPAAAQSLLVDDEAVFRSRFEREGAAVITVMNAVFACRPVPDAARLVGAPAYGYVATHQVLGLLLAEERGCLSPAVLRREGGVYLARVEREFELSQGRMNDLQVERAAILALAGRLDLVPPAFLARLVAAQGEDGLWHFDEPAIRLQLMSPEHATALAYYVLSAASAGRP